MTSKDRRAEDRAALQRLLEIHGADRTRWPARERFRLAGVIGEDRLAAKMLAEAQALDRLLDRAPRASKARIEALEGRIVAAALRSHPPRLTAIAGRKSAPTKGRLGFGQLRASASALKFAEWPAAAVLAASLVVGVMLGTAGTLDTTMQDVAKVTGFKSGTTMALGEDTFGQIDEELL